MQDQHKVTAANAVPDVHIQVLQGSPGPIITDAILNARPKVSKSNF